MKRIVLLILLANASKAMEPDILNFEFSLEWSPKPKRIEEIIKEEQKNDYEYENLIHRIYLMMAKKSGKDEEINPTNYPNTES